MVLWWVKWAGELVEKKTTQIINKEWERNRTGWFSDYRLHTKEQGTQKKIVCKSYISNLYLCDCVELNGLRKMGFQRDDAWFKSSVLLFGQVIKGETSEPHVEWKLSVHQCHSIFSENTLDSLQATIVNCIISPLSPIPKSRARRTVIPDNYLYTDLYQKNILWAEKSNRRIEEKSSKSYLMSIPEGWIIIK